MTSSPARPVALVVLGLAASLALAGCGGSSSGGDTSAAAPSGNGPVVDLKGVCPADVVVQTDWNPEADHGHLYEMLGADPSVDTKHKSVTGDLMSGGKPTGVKLTIRSGGPAIGYSSVSQQMYTDSKITMGYVSTDEAVQYSDKFPTTAFFAETNVSPQMIMWDPKTYPDVTDIASLGKALSGSGGVVRYFKGAAYMDYLSGSGVLPKGVLDSSYDGTPLKFVGAKGKDAQQGFATAEPYLYRHEVGAWKKPVKFQLINDTGYPIYPEAMSVRTGDLQKLTPCLTKLTPIMQQADVDYIADPDAANDLIVDLVTKYNNGWVYDKAVASFAAKQFKALNLTGNGPSGFAGEMDASRVQKVIDIDTPIDTAAGSKPKAGLTPQDLFTNSFLSTSVKFPG